MYTLKRSTSARATSPSGIRHSFWYFLSTQSELALPGLRADVRREFAFTRGARRPVVIYRIELNLLLDVLTL